MDELVDALMTATNAVAPDLGGRQLDRLYDAAQLLVDNPALARAWVDVLRRELDGPAD